MAAIKESTISLKELIKATLSDPNILARLVDQQGDLFTFKAPGIKGHIFAHPRYIEHVFTHQPEYFRSEQIINIVRNVLGDYGLLTINDEKIWKKDRESLNVLFRPDLLQRFAEIMVNNINEGFGAFETYANNQQPILIEKHFTKMTLNNLLNTIFGGVQINTDAVPLIARKIFYLTSPPVFPLVKLFGKIPMPLYFKYKKTKKCLNKIGDEIVEQAFKTNIAPDNLIKCLAKAYGFESYEQLNKKMKKRLRSEALTFLLAGHDTTAALIVHACVYFSLYPLVADKVYAEVQSQIGSRAPTYEDLKNLPYIRAVIQETLRLWPPGTYLIRSPVEDDRVEGHLVKKGDMVIIPTFATQRHWKYWTNPEGFEPNRFLQPLTEEQKWLYSPFALGPQSCIGAQFAKMQATLILVMLAQRYRLTLTPGCSLERDPGMVNRMNINITMMVEKV